ncbi:MAG: hypothetical protein HC912_05960 [Saprospiraceae bacterium]|nr:hypothetical protein [Saprospiraceae bacterium]
MKSTLMLVLFLLHLNLFSQDLPLIFSTNFEDGVSLNQFECTDVSAWRINDEKALALVGASQYQPRVRSPLNIAILKNYRVGDFILEADLKQTGREYGHRDMCLFFGFKDASNFYYVHMASEADPNAHNIFLVNDAPRKNIAEKTNAGVKWGGEWHRVKIVRTVKTGLIQVFFDDMETPIMEAHDEHHEAGYIGFGSFDDTGMIDNIQLYGELIPSKMGIFH